MKLSDVKELYYIAPVDNLLSILTHGILSHEKSRKIRCKSVADPVIQKRRVNKVVPGGFKLHSYANLYFNPRNAMMSKRRDMCKELVVLCIERSVLSLNGVVLADGNASGDYVRFFSSPHGLAYLEKGLIFARDWRSEDRIEYFKRKSAVCAEVLVPHFVNFKYIHAIYVSCNDSRNHVIGLLKQHKLANKIYVEPDIFFV